MGDSPLGAIKVIDVSDEKGAYSTKLLADMGADVIKVEPPSGDRLRFKPPFKDGVAPPDGSLYFAYYHSNKRGVTLDVKSHVGRSVALELADTADVIVTSLQPREAKAAGLTTDDWAATNPAAIVCSITPFGLTGPYRNYRSTHLTANAMGGSMFMQGPPEGPPLTVPGQPMYDMAGGHGALAIQVALWNREAIGSQVIDIAVHDLLATRDHAVVRYSTAEVIQRRQLASKIPSGTWQCKDGLVELQVWTPRMWEGFAEMIGRPPEISDPAWATPVYRILHGHEIRDLISGFLAEKSVDDVVEAAQANHIPATPLYSPRAFIGDKQAVARQMFLDVDDPVLGRYQSPGAPYRSSPEMWSRRTSAPRLGEHNVEVFCKELGHTSGELESWRHEGIM
jgi:crotonobetainyl-CoA:carnitine CoA-transferase CaiB-like acyl-CoA transferase